MIRIEDIEHGWLKFTLNDGKTKASFRVSYMCDFINMLKDILLVGDNTNAQGCRLTMDGETEELHLISILGYDSKNINIIWDAEDSKCNITTHLFSFNHEELIHAFAKEFNRVRHDYYTNFDMDMMDAMENEMSI